jgi:hypothetical protein
MLTSSRHLSEKRGLACASDMSHTKYITGDKDFILVHPTYHLCKFVKILVLEPSRFRKLLILQEVLLAVAVGLWFG